MAAVAEGVAEIRTGALEKLVLARDIVATVPDGVNAAEILRELAVRYRECWTYGVDGLVGSTPEMLIQVEGRTAQARVLAGTLDRRDAEGMAGSPLEFAERVLAGSEKQRHEHDIAIQSLTTQLAPFSEAMNAHSEPFILELPNVWHLASDVKAELTEVEGHVPTCLALINALHPTAAVCGTPTTVAGALIRKLEHLDRGPYAGPVGWLDAAGNGEWGIALRGAVIESPQTGPAVRGLRNRGGFGARSRAGGDLGQVPADAGIPRHQQLIRVARGRILVPRGLILSSRGGCAGLPAAAESGIPDTPAWASLAFRPG